MWYYIFVTLSRCDSLSFSSSLSFIFFSWWVSWRSIGILWLLFPKPPFMNVCIMYSHCTFNITCCVMNKCLWCCQVVNLPPPHGECQPGRPLAYYASYTSSACLSDCATRHTVELCGCRDTYMPQHMRGTVRNTCACASHLFCMIFCTEAACDQVGPYANTIIWQMSVEL